MALNDVALGTLITAELVAAAPMTTPAQLGLAIAKAVVKHLKDDAVVTPTALVAPVGGGPVTGTGKLT